MVPGAYPARVTAILLPRYWVGVLLATRNEQADSGLRFDGTRQILKSQAIKISHDTGDLARTARIGQKLALGLGRPSSCR